MSVEIKHNQKKKKYYENERWLTSIAFSEGAGAILVIGGRSIR
jgi:hypothetical protein